MKLYTYHKKGRVKFYSTKKQSSDLEEKVLTLTKEQKDKLKQNLEPVIRNGNLEFIKETPTYTELKKQELRDRIANNEDPKTLLNNILDLIK